MSTSRTEHSVDVVEGVSGVLVGGGVVTMALFPLAIPILALTAIALLPLLLVALPVGLLPAAVIAPIMLARRLRRRARVRAPSPAGTVARGRP